MNPIETDRLILRSFLEKDASSLFAYLSKPRVNCFVSEKVNTFEEARIEVKKRCKLKNSIAICLRDTDEVIGDLFFEKEEPDTYDIGWNINVDYQGKGYAFESAEALFIYLFEVKKARRIYAYVEDDNIRSQKLCKRLGMRNEGCFKEFISFINNEDGTPKYENTMQFAILKKEWDSNRES